MNKIREERKQNIRVCVQFFNIYQISKINAIQKLQFPVERIRFYTDYSYK